MSLLVNFRSRLCQTAWAPGSFSRLTKTAGVVRRRKRLRRVRRQLGRWRVPHRDPEPIGRPGDLATPPSRIQRKPWRRTSAAPLPASRYAIEWPRLARDSAPCSRHSRHSLGFFFRLQILGDLLDEALL